MASEIEKLRSIEQDIDRVAFKVSALDQNKPGTEISNPPRGSFHGGLIPDLHPAQNSRFVHVRESQAMHQYKTPLQYLDGIGGKQRDPGSGTITGSTTTF